MRTYLYRMLWVCCMPLLMQQVWANDLSQLETALEAVEEPKAGLRILDQYQADTGNWPLQDQARYHSLRGHLLMQSKRYSDALIAQDQAVALYEQVVPLPPDLVRSLLDRSYVQYLKTSDPSVYCADRRRALTVARTLDDNQLLARALVNTAYCYETDREHFVEGLALLEEAMQLPLQDEEGTNLEGMIYNATGLIYRSNQIPDKAYEYLLAAYESWASRQDIQDMFNMQHSLVGVAVDMADWELAQQHVDRLYELAAAHPEYADFEFFAHMNAGLLAFARRDFKQAVKLLEQTENLQHTTQERYFVRRARHMRAIAYFRSGDTQQAASLARAELKRAQELNSNTRPMLHLQAIAAYDAGDYLQGMYALWQSVDAETDQRRDFIRLSSFAQARLFDEKVAFFEKNALQQALAINRLRLEAEQHKSRVFILSAGLVGVMALGLMVWVLYLARSRKSYRTLSQTDFLTGLANRRFTFEQGQAALDEAMREQGDFSLVLFDIDNFKQINDRFGHDVGDAAIRLVAQCALEVLPPDSVVGRIGGEEFLAFLPRCDLAAATALAEKLRIHIHAQTMHSGDDQFNLTVSLGVSARMEKDSSLQQLLLRADQALYAAKKSGRNQVKS